MTIQEQPKLLHTAANKVLASWCKNRNAEPIGYTINDGEKCVYIRYKIKRKVTKGFTFLTILQMYDSICKLEQKQAETKHIKVQQPELLTRTTNYYNFVDGWCEAGGHNGKHTLKCVWERAKELKAELGRKVSWYGLGYLMCTEQYEGRKLLTAEIKLDNILPDEL